MNCYLCKKPIDWHATVVEEEFKYIGEKK